MKYNIESIESLKRLGFEFPFTKKSLIKDLNKVLTLLKSDQLQLVKVEDQLKPFMKDVKISRMDIIKELIMLTKHYGILYTAENTTLETYATHLNQLKAWQIAQKLTK
jgi:transcription termination factor NusB